MSFVSASNDLQSALDALKANRFDDAELIISRLLETDSCNGQLHHLAGVIAMLRGQIAQATASFSRAVRFNPDLAQAHSNLGLARLEGGFADEAALDCRRATEISPGQPELHFNLAVALQTCGRWAEAESEYRKELEINPTHAKALLNLGAVVHRQGRSEEAEAAYQAAKKQAPESPEVHNNLGHLRLAAGRLPEAEKFFRKALALRPEDADALAGLAAALRRGGDIDSALEICKRFPMTSPNANLHRQLGMTLVETGDLPGAIEAFERGVSIKRAPGRLLSQTEDQGEATISKLRHDLQQLEYLAARGLLPNEFEQAPAALRNVLNDLPADMPAAQIFALPVPARRRLAGFYNKLLYRDPPAALDGSALNPQHDPREVQDRYLSRAPGMTVIDDFLRPAALLALRKFCLESTFWFDFRHPNGYLGAYLEDGFCCPLLEQIAADLRRLMPKLIGDLPLRQMWAYKYDSQLDGIEMHADFAAVNVNFWITADDANLDPDGGGMIVWDVEAPPDWDFERYNSSASEDQAAISEFLERSGAQPWRIPYRENRAVIFNSDLFHRTDKIDFKNEYDRRRINITMLFGNRKVH